MRIKIGIVCLVFALMNATALWAQAPDTRAVVRYTVRNGENIWKKVNALSGDLSSREIFRYALVLCEADVYPERLKPLLDLGYQMQDRIHESKGYGNFRWRWREDRVMDFNAVEFCMQSAGVLWLRHRDTLPVATRETLREILDTAVQGCLGHWVRESYTNIALMNALNLILLGEGLDRSEVAGEGYARLDRIMTYIWEFGLHEYDSPTYYGTDLESLVLLERFAQRESGRAQARALLELFWTDIALNWIPMARRLGGSHSRTYDYLYGLGHLDTALWVMGWLPGRSRGGTE